MTHEFPADLASQPTSITEGEDAEALFTLSLAAAGGREIRVGYATTDAAAQAGSDYIASAGTAILPAGTTRQRTAGRNIRVTASVPA